jgi:hypothetical protein
MLLQKNEKSPVESLLAPALPNDRNDPFVYFANIIRGNIQMKNYDLSAPANNEIMMMILEAAKASVKSGKTIVWDQFYKSK